MDRIDATRDFVTAVERGSLASAARSLGHSPAMVTRAIALLEGRLGMRLLHRNTRALRLTRAMAGEAMRCDAAGDRRNACHARPRASKGAGQEKDWPIDVRVRPMFQPTDLIKS